MFDVVLILSAVAHGLQRDKPLRRHYRQRASFPLQPTPGVPHFLNLRRNQEKVKNKLVSGACRDLRQPIYPDCSFLEFQ